MTNPTKPSPGGTNITLAKEEDIPRIKELVDAAYSKYIERIGKPPAPMLADWPELLETAKVFVLRSNEDIVGGIVLQPNAGKDSMEVNNAVVDPGAQGKGYGRILLEHAEEFARGKGFTALTLYTNAKMYENLTIYAKIGYVEVDRKVDEGYDRVYYRKEI